LTNTPRDIGKYYIFREYDNQGTVIAQWAYIWYGSSYRRMMMGAFGPPGPVPRITPEVELIDPDLKSYVRTFGPRLDPDWLFYLAAPPGPSGPSQALYLFDDVNVDLSTVVSGDLITFTGEYTEGGVAVWEPRGIGNLLPRAYSVPQSAFWGFTGFSQEQTVGQFTVPAQSVPWTPIVWGHMGEGGVMIAGNPFRVGARVLLNDPATGMMVARGMGTTIGECNIYPHYSTTANKTQAITPTNGYAVIPPGHPATLYVNLWNDGEFGLYWYNPQNSQLFIEVLPMEQEPGAAIPPPAPPEGGPITIIQTCDNNNPTFPSPVTQGNTVVVLVGGFSHVGLVTCNPPTLDTAVVKNTAAVWNNGGTNAQQGPAGTLGAGGYWIAAFVLPNCPATPGAVALSCGGDGDFWGWQAIEVNGLGDPAVNMTSYAAAGAGATSYSSGQFGPTGVDNALILGLVAAGGGMSVLPSTPWTSTQTTLEQASGYQNQTVKGPNYVYTGVTNGADANIAGGLALIAQPGTA
jgi:hypothetical protein